MANYWYVRSGSGTAGPATARATTDITVQRTGAFSSMAVGDHFGSIEECCAGDDTGIPVAGDFIFVADDHAFSSGSPITHGVAAACDHPVNVICVKETACDESSTGASETSTSSSNDITLNAAVDGTKLHYYGITLTAGDNFYCACDEAEWIFENCTLEFTGSGDKFHSKNNGNYFGFINTTLLWTGGTTADCFVDASDATYYFSNCVFDGGTGALADVFPGTGDAVITFENTDLTDVAGYIFAGTPYYSVNYRLLNCKMNADPALFYENDFTKLGQRFLATNSSSDSDKAEYQFLQHDVTGTVQDSGDDGVSGGIYRSQSTPFENGNKVSFKCATSANCSHGHPLVFDLPTKFADLSASGTDELTVYIASATAMTTANTWIEVSYPDGTNKQTWNTISSRATDVLSATALTADGGSSDWENNGVDLTTENEYKITVDTSGDAGAECVPHIRFCTTIPSITFYVDTTVDLT